MDNFLLQAIVDEAAPHLIGQRLGKVYQPGRTDLVLDFKSGPEQALIISTDPDRLGLYLGHRPANDSASKSAALPAFAARLRKSLGSSRLIGFEKLGDDRVIFLDFRAVDESGKPIVSRLAISLVGRSADIYLVENQIVVASLRNRDVGQTYQPASPAPDRLDPFLLPNEAWLGLIAGSDGNIAVAAASLLGFTRTFIRELEFLGSKVGPVAALREILARITERPAHARMYSTAGLDSLDREPGLPQAEMILTHVELQHLEGWIETRFPTLSVASERYFALLACRRVFDERRHDLTVQAKAQLKKQTSLRDKLRQELAHCGSADTHQRFGELLLANLHQVAKSGNEFLVTDYFTQGEPLISVPDAHKGDARIAADHYFKLARRSRNGISAINQRLPLVEATVIRLQEMLRRLSETTTADDLDGLQGGSGLPGKQKRRVEKPRSEQERERLPGVRRYRSSDGYEILIGRTDRDNDNLTLKIAKSSDLWFHAADYPGSHVVLRNPQRKAVPPVSIREAAELAAKFSQAGKDTKVAVNYCERKFVSKPKGFAPGQVRLASFKTILVAPREAGEHLQ
ncbi:MAG: NFACT family protein [Acidobacteriota bacterium]